MKKKSGNVIRVNPSTTIQLTTCYGNTQYIHQYLYCLKSFGERFSKYQREFLEAAIPTINSREEECASENTTYSGTVSGIDSNKLHSERESSTNDDADEYN